MSTRNLVTLILIALLTAAAFLFVSRPGDPEAQSGWDREKLDKTYAIGQMAGFVFADELAPPAAAGFVNAAGKGAVFADYKGKVLLVNFWASWCLPCRHEMPALDALQAEYGGPYFEVIAISIDRKGAEHAETFLRDELGVKNFDSWHEGDRKTARLNGITAMPTTVLIGADGVILGRLAGAAEWNSPEAHTLIQWAIDRE
ncbi:MAG: TlpA disulfide reductase family protein [Alphaproteobacteria bacterium]